VVPPIPGSLNATSASPCSGDPEILFAGQVIRGKGVDLLLRALALTPGRWHATIAGAGNHLEACRTLAQKLGIAGQVTFTGRVSQQELDRYYRSALFTVVPSRWPEPFGMVGIEAMSRGRAVIAFDVGGISDWLQHQQNGLLVPEANIAQLAFAISSLLQDPGMAATLGANAARGVAGQYRHDIYLDRIGSLLEAAA
jgi:glycosyltransferase involved in cell wall biosynthesis